MNTNTQISTDFLFSNQSYMTGMGSVFNIFGGYYNFNTSSSEFAADEKAVSSDWSNVAQDIYSAIQEVD